MNIAKKTFAVVLSVAMLITSLATCTTAFAAEKKQFTAMGTTQTFAVNFKETQDEYGFHYENVDGHSYFTFTPAATGYYKISLASTPVYRSNETGYSYTATPGAERVDYASVALYDNYQAAIDQLLGEDRVVGVSTSDFEYATGYTQTVANEYPNATYAQYNTLATAKLTAGKVYYVDAYTSMWNWNALDNGKRTYLSGASLSITPTDWRVSKSSETVAVQQFVVDDEIETFGISVPYFNATYVGAAKDVIVPADIDGISVRPVGTDNKTITSLSISNGVKKVSGFSDLKSLAAVNLGMVEEIASDCFANDSALTSIVIPATVKTIGSSAFDGCSSLSSVTIANGVKTIGSFAFYDTALKGAVIPASVTSIGNYAFGFVGGFNVNTVNPYDTEAVAVPGFALATIGCAEAFDYAAKNGIACYDITYGCPHPYETATVPATLFAKGSTTSVCPICGNTVTKSIKKKTFKISALKSAKKAQITVKAAKQDGITGYQIQYSTSKKFTKKTTKTVTVKSTKALNKTIKGLKSGKKYYVRVRAYNDSAKKTVYSAYTATKNVKVK